jgi:hypothetical protein
MRTGRWKNDTVLEDLEIRLDKRAENKIEKMAAMQEIPISIKSGSLLWHPRECIFQSHRRTQNFE